MAGMDSKYPDMDIAGWAEEVEKIERFDSHSEFV
jgi:hypothetical protein